MDNQAIAERIKKAREDRNFTQMKVATFLGKKSPNAISELERGNVNITAEDIFKLSHLFNKPIMYFYGQDYPEDYTEDIFGIIEQLTPEEIDELKILAQATSEQKALMADIQGNPELQEDRDTIFAVIKTINTFLKPLSNQITRALQVRKMLEGLVGIREYSDEDFLET